MIGVRTFLALVPSPGPGSMVVKSLIEIKPGPRDAGRTNLERDSPLVRLPDSLLAAVGAKPIHLDTQRSASLAHGTSRSEQRVAKPAPAGHHPLGVLVGRQLRDMLVFHPGHLVGQVATAFDGCKKLKRGPHGERLARLGNPDQTQRLMALSYLNRSVVALFIPGRSSFSRRRGGFRASSRMSCVHQSG